MERVGDVVALELAGAPAGHEQGLVVDAERDVGDQRRHGAEGLERRRQLLGLGRLGRDLDHLGRGDLAVAVLGVPEPDAGAEVGGRDDHADEAPRLVGVVRGPQLEHHLLLRPEVDGLLVRALAHVPDVEVVAVLAAEQELGVDPRLDHVRRAPLAGDDAVKADVPPDVVGELLRAAVDLPLALDREVVVVEQEDAAGAVAVGGAERAGVEPVGAAVERVRTRVAGLALELGGLDDLGQLGLARVVLDVDDVDARRAQAGHEEVAALDVRVGGPGAQGGRARVPAEVVQLVADVGHVEPPDTLARADVDDVQRVGLVALGVERDDVGKVLGRAGDRALRRGIEAGVRLDGRHDPAYTTESAIAFWPFSSSRGRSPPRCRSACAARSRSPRSRPGP